MAVSRPLCISHANCVDGFGAAWVVNKFFNPHPGDDNIDFHWANYGTLPPAVIGRHVIIVDFSYPADALRLIGEMSNGVLVLDHHETAQMDLTLFARAWPGKGNPDWQPRVFTKDKSVAVCAHFDMQRSGAGMAWDYFFPDEPRPLLIDWIEDRDLWRFKVPGSRELHSYLMSFEWTFDLFDELGRNLANDTVRDDLLTQGRAIDRAHLMRCHEVIAACRVMMAFPNPEGGEWFIPVCNAPFHMASDIGNIMSQGHPFAMTYVDSPADMRKPETGARRHWSLRSQKGTGINVAAVAKQFGGGGHANAAGFSTGAPGVRFEPRRET